jgi:hypothetical protein
MQASNIRFGEAYRLSIPAWEPYLRGHDGIDFQFVNLAPLEPNSAKWNRLEGLLEKNARLVNAYDPRKQEKATYIITNGPRQDTFTRVQTIESQMQAITGGKNKQDIHAALALALPLEGLITGHETVVELPGSAAQQAEALERQGIIPGDTPER